MDLGWFFQTYIVIQLNAPLKKGFSGQETFQKWVECISVMGIYNSQ